MTRPIRSFLRLHEADDVGLAVTDLSPATLVERDLALTGLVPRGYKFALHAIPEGSAVRRYGQVIGEAARPIAAGDHVHVHNLRMTRHQSDAALPPAAQASVAAQRLTFEGLRRPDGRVDTRNYVSVLITVNCSGSVARLVVEAAERSRLLGAYPQMDGLVPLAHGTGCGMTGGGEGDETLFRTLVGEARNADFAGVLVIGLGCKVMQLPALLGPRGLREEGRLEFLTIQDSGGTERTIAAGLAALHRLCAMADTARREAAPAAELVVGLQCGGSEGCSGITANPALGHASDLLVAMGVTTILSETPEIYGAEHLLMARAERPEVVEALAARIRWWEEYTARNGAEMDNNPSPGNKCGGLTTLLEESLGAVATGGTAPLRAVYRYAEPFTDKGFVFMDRPGYDPASVTGQVASGATLIVFTTGRGSVSGFKPAPGVKLATNSEMFAKMEGDMDLNCGEVVTEGVSLAEKGEEILRLMLDVASGARTKSERLGFGGVEFVPWQIGALM